MLRAAYGLPDDVIVIELRGVHRNLRNPEQAYF